MCIELSIVMPCLNEARTVGVCIGKARAFMERYDVAGEVVVADNGSRDGSQAIAMAAGARVVEVPHKGYGNALRGGIAMGIALLPGRLQVGQVSLDVHALFYSGIFVTLGCIGLWFYLFGRFYAQQAGYYPMRKYINKAVNKLTVERGLLRSSATS